MMAVRCYLLFVVVVVAALMHHVSGTTLVRSSNGGRIKGATTANDSERHLQVDTERKTKKHAGNILLTLDQVWTDASSTETKVKIKTVCKKPKKGKKSTDGAAGVVGDGVGVGKGSGKGGAGKGSGSNSGANVEASNTTVTADATGNTTASANASSETNSTNATRWLQSTNSTNSNVFGNQTSSTTSSTNATTSTATTDNSSPNSTFVVTVSSGKVGKKAKKAPPQVNLDEIPFCEEEDDVDGDGSAVTAPSAPIQSPVSSPATVAAPSTSVQSPVVASPTMQSPVVASPTVPSNSNSSNNNTSVVGQASVCEAYRLGAAPTDAPSQNHTTMITMNVDVGSDVNSIYSQMGTILREEIGPMLLDCVERRLMVHRKEQENATELVNIVFSDPTFTGESCSETPENATCVPSMFASELYFYGDEPVGFDEKLRQALLFTDFDIPGLQNFADVQVSSNADEDAAGPEPAPVAQPSDRAAPPTSPDAIEATQESRNGPSPGVAVAITVSVLALVLAALFVVRRHREAKSSDSLSKHIEFTDDFADDAGAETADDNSAFSPIQPPPQKSYVLSDQSLDESWNAPSRRSSQQGQEVYAAQTSFVEADGPDPRLMNLPRRFYESADTVNL